MMHSLLNANIAGAPHHHGPSGAYTVDTMLNEISRQLVGNTKRYSRGLSGQQRVPTAMRISKPGSANNSPRSSTLQSRRRTLIGDGFQGRLVSPAVESTYLPTPASEIPSEPFYEQNCRPARPISWHPSPHYHTQQPLYPQQASSTPACSYPIYGEVDILASLQHLPPTPAIYSGYASPTESFSPLSLPYSSFSSQPVYSPLSQPAPVQHEQQGQQEEQQEEEQAPAAFRSSPCVGYSPTAALPELAYPPATRLTDDSLVWESYPPCSSLLDRHTAPPTPEDFAYSITPNDAAASEVAEARGQKETAYQTVIVDDSGDDESEGEILYGMGLYDAPDHSKGATDEDNSSLGMLHRSAIVSLLSSRDADRAGAEEDCSDTGKGLGLKLEDAWEPPASDDEEDADEDADADGERQDE
ncbi:hypothetical protein MMYC01_204196 [Madurella mycetomatis]|uniref:Uncharacterized protein n=1 Tax=Madurella mycetomatis TaxID=100816 RepID=A0A175W2V2_9PEZI|nr:hypothetical protein MMYC01_204196 [Madurella mycetomatis]